MGKRRMVERGRLWVGEVERGEGRKRGRVWVGKG
jgi:hypothetical protein